MNLIDLIKKVDALAPDDLRKLADYSIQKLNDISRAKSRAAAFQFQRGQKVSFVSSKLGGKILGIIEKVNRTTTLVKTEHNGPWKVSTAMLKAEEA